MRVALLTNFIPPYRVSLFRALRQKVGELRVFISTVMGQDRAWSPDWQDLDVVLQKSLSFRRTWRQPDFEEPYETFVPYDTLWQLARYRPDVIITGELGPRSLQALLYGRMRGVPVVLWATLSDRTEQHWSASRRALRKFMIPRFKRVIVNGADGARYIRRFRDDAPLHVPYTTDMQNLLALPLTGRPRKLLFVGALTHRKGFHLLAEACRQRRFELLVVGDGPLRRDMPQITYAGNVVYQDLPRWFEQAGFLIMPSLADEWGVVVNESLAAGVPVIGSVYSQAVAELIENGHNGWRFQPTDVDAVGDVIERALATSDIELQRMRHQARETAGRLHPEAAAEQFAGLLKSL